MKASEARAKAIEAMDKNIECHEELEKIYKKIEDQANKGYLSVHATVSYKYHDYITTKLKEKGYKVVIVFQKFEIYW